MTISPENFEEEIHNVCHVLSIKIDRRVEWRASGRWFPKYSLIIDGNVILGPTDYTTASVWVIGFLHGIKTLKRDL